MPVTATASQNPIDFAMSGEAPVRQKASDYSKRNSAKNRSSTAQSKRSKKSENSMPSSGGDSRRRTSSYAVKSKKLPPNFAENAHELEMSIE